MKSRRGRSRSATTKKAAPHIKGRSHQRNDENKSGRNSATDSTQEQMPSSSACEPCDEGVAPAGIIRHVIDGIMIEEFVEPLPSIFRISVQGEPNVPPVEGSGWSLASAPAAVLDECMCLSLAIAGRVSTTPQALMPSVNVGNAGNKQSLAPIPPAASDKPVPLPTNAAVVVPVMRQATATVTKTYEAANRDHRPVHLSEQAVGVPPEPVEHDNEHKLPLSNNARNWTVEDVAAYIRKITGREDLAEKFRAQDIDGEALFLLREYHLMTYMGIKLGPALVICSMVKSLQEKL